MPRTRRPSVRRALSLGVALVIATLSCGRDITGPSGVRLSIDFSFEAVFAGGTMASAVASDLVPYTRVRLVLLRPGGKVAVDQVADFPSDVAELRIPVRIELLPEAPAAGEQMDLLLRYINATSDTVFSGGPFEVTVAETRPGQQPPPPVQIPVDYTGPGSEATQVAISQTELTVVSGDAFVLTAAAMTGQQMPVPAAPIAWRSLDVALATITSPAAGNGVTLAGRGTARIVAALLNGPADTLTITVTPRAQSVAAVSGNDQSGISGAPLAQPVVVRVLATDNQPMAGVPITFAAGNGGSVGTPSAVTDAAGLAQTTWTLGSALGAQTLTATSAGLTGSPVTFTAQAPTLQLLHHYPIQGSLADAAGTADGAPFGQFGLSSVLGLDGATAYVSFPSQLVPATGSYSVSLFVRQASTPAAPAVYLSQGATGGPGFFIGHTATGELRVTESWTATGVSAPPSDGLFHHIVLVVDATAGQSRLWVDGVLRATLPQALATGATGTTTRLGRLWDSLGDFFAGELDEIRVYAGALGAAQVGALWTTGASAPDRLVFGTQPSTAEEGAAIAPPVTVRRVDALGRLQTSFTGSVSIDIGVNPEDGALGGTTTRNAVGGVATFDDLSIDTQSSGYTLRASTAGLDDVESEPFTITAGTAVATALEFLVQPSNTFTGAAISPAIVVRALDAQGAPVTGFSENVTLALGANPGGATLGGALALAAVNGEATFSGITLSAAGTGYTLVATAGGLTGATSTAFDVVEPGSNLVSWTNPAGGMWNTASNWSTGMVPGASDSAVIALDGTYTVTLDANVTVSALTIGGGTGTRTLVAGPRTVTVAGAITVLGNAGLTMAGGTINGGGTVVNEGQMTIRGTISNSLENRALLVVRGSGSSFSGPLTTTTASTLRMLGASGDGTGHLTVANTFTNHGAIELTSIDGGFTAQLSVTNGWLENASTGTITSSVGAGGTRVLGVRLVNRGTLTTNAALLINRASSSHTNEFGGEIVLAGGNLTFTQSGTSPSFVNLGSITLASGRTMTVNGGVLDLDSGTMTGGEGTLTTNGATVLFNTAAARVRLNLITTTVLGGLTVPAGDSIVLAGGSPTMDLVNEGLVISQGAVSWTGAITTTPGSTIRLRGASGFGTSALTIAGELVNHGGIELTSINGGFSSQLTVNGGLTNAETGTITSAVGAGGGRTIAAQLLNEGLLTTPTALVLARTDAAHVNSGAIDVTGGNLTVTQTGVGAPSFTNTGIITLTGGRTLNVTGGQLNLQDGTLVGGTGTLSTNNATVAFTTTSARVRLNLVNTTVPGTFTVSAGDSIVLVGGSPTFTLVNDGLVIAQGAITFNGTFTTGLGSALRLRGASGYGTAALTFPAALTNTAAIELTSIEAGFSATLTVAGGLTNMASGTITAMVGAGGARTIAAQLDNQGAILLPAALTIARTDAAHVNSGTIDLTGGNLTVTQTGVAAPSFTNTGVITMAGGRTMSVSGGQVNGGTATLTATNATLAFATPEARTRLNLVNTTVPGTFTIPAGDSIVLVGGSPTMTIANEGTIISQDAVTFSGSITTATPTSTLLLRGANGYGTSAFTYDGTLTNSGHIVMTSIEAGFSASLTATGGLVNTSSGVIDALVGVGGARTIAAQLENQGIINTPAALTLARASAGHVNAGSINVTTGNLTVTQTGTTPSFSNLPDGVINLTAGRTMSVTGGAIDLTQGMLNGGAATLSTNNTTLRFSVPTAVTRFNLVNTVVPHTVTVPQADSLVLVGGALDAPVVNNGLLLVQGAVTLGGAVTTVPGSIIRARGNNTFGTGALTVTNGFTNAARIELTSINAGFNASLAVTNGTLVNAPDGVIEAMPGAGGARTLAAAIDNQGTVTVSSTTALALARPNSAHLNSGTIDLTSGNLTVTQSGAPASFTNTGSLNLPAGRTLAFSGGAVDLTAGLVNGPSATVTANGSTLSFTPATVLSRLVLTTTAVPHTVTVPSGQLLHLVGGALNAPIVNEGTVLINGGVTLGGAITNSVGAVLRVQGVTGFGTGALTVTNGFTNAGTIEITSLGTGFSSSMAITTGALTNAAGGTLSVLTGAGGARTYTGALIDNLGTITAGTAWTANTALDQRSIMNVTAGTTTVNGASTFHAGSVTTLSGTGALVKAGGCTNSGGTGNGSLCP